MIRRTLTDLGFALLATALLAGCGAAGGGAATPDPTPSPTDAAAADPGAAAGMCLEGATDCVDTPQLLSDEPVPIDETGLQQFRKDARYYLGRPQSELNELIRVARIDDVDMAVTDDYQIGRITVELDTVNEGEEPIVTSATVEMPEGPETFTLKE